MKKIQIILLTMVIMFILVACKEQHTNTERTNEPREDNDMVAEIREQLKEGDVVLSITIK